MAIEDTLKPNTTGPDKSKEGKERLSFRILIADDMEAVRKSLKGAFELEGYTVETVENGQLLLDRLASGEYSLVITDQNMPGIKGFEVLKRIRVTEKTKNLPVIIFSDGEELQKAVENSGGIFCDKGDPNYLLDAVEKIFKDKK